MKSLLQRNVGLLLCVLASQALAASYPIPQPPWYGQFMFGYGVSRTPYTDEVLLTNAPGGASRYLSDKFDRSVFYLGFGFGRNVVRFYDGTTVGLGVEADYLRNDRISGVVTQGINAVPVIGTLEYNYDLQSFLYLFKVHVSKKNISDRWGGYINAGVGGAINALSHYVETVPAGSAAVPMAAPFGNHSKNAIAMSLGIGVTHGVGESSLLAIGYRFIYTGRGRFNPSPVQTTLDTLDSPNFGHHLFNVSVTV